jgi:hypothetical protein
MREVALKCYVPILLLALAPAANSQECVPSPEAKAAFDKLPVRQASQTDWQYRQARISALEAMRDRYPDDVFAQREFLDGSNLRLMDPAAREKAIAGFRDRHEKKPGDVRLAYLYGLALEGRRSSESVRLFEDALAKDPGFPLPHLELVYIYNSPVFENKGLALRHLKAFLEACPSSYEGYDELSSVSDKELLTASAARLRRLVTTRSDNGAMKAYGVLWSLEFKTHSQSEYPALRKQVSDDLERIRALKLEDKPRWYDTLQQGYKLVNDQKQSEWAGAERERRFPGPILPDQLKWQRAHPFPAGDDPADKQHAFYTALLKETDTWIKQGPGNQYAWALRLQAMLRLEEPAAADVEAAVSVYVRLIEANAGPPGPGWQQYFFPAEVLARRHLAPERTLALAEKGLAQWEESEHDEPLSDLRATKESVEGYNFYRLIEWLRGAALEAGAYLDLKQVDNARAELVRMDERLRSLDKLAGVTQEEKKQYSVQLAAWWGLMARAAEARNHPLDAMAFYGNGLLARLDAQQKPEIGVRDELEENAHRLWTALGGTAEGWEMWYGQRAGALAGQATLSWEEANQPMPLFELADLTGKTWNLASLKGKVTFLVFWASW